MRTRPLHTSRDGDSGGSGGVGAGDGEKMRVPGPWTIPLLAR